MKNSIFAILMLMIVSVAFAQDKNESKTFNNIKNLRLSTASGDIAIKKSSSGETKVSVRYTYDEKDYHVVMDEVDGRLVLEEKFERGSYSGSSYWTLEVPDNLTMKLNTGSGDIRIDQLTIADIKSNSGSGDVELASVKGRLDFNTGSGDYVLENIDGELDLNTGSGNINVRNSKGSFDLNAGSGDIRFEKVNGNFQVNTGSGDIKANNVTIAGTSKFNNGSGNATVSLGAELKSSISLNSGSGDSKLEFNDTQISGEVIMTANKPSGDIVAPFKFDKEETIDDGGSQKRIQKTAKLGNSDIKIRIGTGSGTAEITK
jgi:DUF4097 and DUF4098 domain-containing protein YvlB